jgi:hypothetical protein
MSESTVDGGAESDRSNSRSMTLNDGEAFWGLEGKLVDNAPFRRDLYFFGLGLDPLPGKDLEPKQSPKQARASRTSLSNPPPPLSLSVSSNSLASEALLM